MSYELNVLYGAVTALGLLQGYWIWVADKRFKLLHERINNLIDLKILLENLERKNNETHGFKSFVALIKEQPDKKERTVVP